MNRNPTLVNEVNTIAPISLFENAYSLLYMCFMADRCDLYEVSFFTILKDAGAFK
jgi:hypothetical protein